jgi:ABC-type amino acid transport substrate-binding protein
VRFISDDVDREIERMLADGTIAELSRRRFAGEDLSDWPGAPPVTP